jgi:hypothetical protein
MSLTSYRAAPPRVGVFGWIGGPGGDLLSRALRHSTMGAGEFHGRVRDGIGCRLPAKATRSSNPPWRRLSVYRRQFAVVRCQTTGVEGSGGVLCAVHHRGRRQADEPRLLLRMISMHGVPPLAAGGVDRGRSDH